MLAVELQYGKRMQCFRSVFDGRTEHCAGALCLVGLAIVVSIDIDSVSKLAVYASGVGCI